MPFRNRVTPYGDFISTYARGDFMGNRGILHNDDRELVRQYAGKRWVTCTLTQDTTTPKRPLMDPRHYTALFFLDEPTALAAGHRPCAQCRRKQYTAFLQYWSQAK